MAAELTVRVSAGFANASGSDTLTQVISSSDSTDAAMLRGQSATTGETTLSFPSSSNRICAVISNTGATNALLVSLDDGESWPLKVPASSMCAFFLANGTADVKVKSAASTTTYDVLTA